MSDKLRKIVQQIEKMAAPPVPSPRNRKGKTPAAAQPGSSGVPERGGNKPVSSIGPSASLPIKSMQKAIQNFANAAVAYVTKQERDGKGKVVSKISEDDSRRNFNDFLAEQFSASADIHGDEFNPDPDASAKNSKQPTDLIQLNNVIDGLRRIGPGSKEALPDGIWDFRTNNAVRNVYAVATALVAANEALGGAAPNDPRVFKRSDLAKLKQAIPLQKDPGKEGVSSTDLTAKAATITTLVEKLSEFYKYYSKSIMNHPAYKRYVTDDIPLLTVQPGKDPAQLDVDQSERLKSSKQITLPYLRVMDKDNKPIMIDGRVALSYLQSRQGLQKMMQDLLGYKQNEVNNGPAMRRIVKTFINRINKIISDYKPVAAPQPKKPAFQPVPANQNIA